MRQEYIKSVYWNTGLSITTNVKKEEKYLIQFLEEFHNKYKEKPVFKDPEVINTLRNSEDLEAENKEYIEDIERKIKASKANDAPYILATAFGITSEPNFPKVSPRKIKDNGGILRDFIAIDYDLQYESELEDLIKITNEKFKGKYQYALYPSTSYPLKPRARLIIPVDKLLNAKSYKNYAITLMDEIGIETYDYTSNTTINHTFNTPFYMFEEAGRATFTTFNKDGEILSINDLKSKINNRKKEKKQSETINHIKNQIEENPQNLKSKKIKVTKKLIEDVSEYDDFWHFAESLALANIKDILSEEEVHQILIDVADGNRNWERDNIKIYETQKTKLNNDPDKKKLVKNITEYFPQLKKEKKIIKKEKNIIQWLLNKLNPDQIRNTEMDITTVTMILEYHLDFGLLKGYEYDKDALVLFNPLTGLWTKDENLIIALSNQIKPSLTPTQIKTIILTLSANARAADKFISPYAGSQYIVFKNGVLDITTMELIDLDSKIVRKLQFTNRHLINIDYKDKPKLITYENDGINGNSWDIEKFIKAYAGNDNEKRKYFLFGLSLGLFAGHNTGVHFDIQGASGSGKSTLSLIYKGLYGTHRVPEILFSNLNENFPITSYPSDSAIIWIKECNTNIPPLSEEKGTPFYDSLADGSARLPLKHSEDLILENPPQVYIDGTRLIHSEDILTGPARRTLAFKLPENIEDLRPQFYSNHIQDRLTDPENLLYLIHEALKAFKDIVPEARQTNFKMNLSVKEDLDLLPEIAKEWRKEFMSADSNLIDWYDEEIEPYLSINNPTGLLTDNFFYRMYLQWYSRVNPNDTFKKYAKSFDKFTQGLKGVFIDKGLSKIYFVEKNGRKRKRITNPESWGFDWNEYRDMYEIPFEFKSSNGWNEVYGKRVANVYYLTDEPINLNNFKKDKKDPIAYIPK